MATTAKTSKASGSKGSSKSSSTKSTKSSSASSQGSSKSATAKTGGSSKSTNSKSSGAGRTGASKSAGTAAKKDSKASTARAATASKSGGSKTSTATKSGAAGKRTASGGAKQSKASTAAKSSSSGSSSSKSNGSAKRKASTSGNAKAKGNGIVSKITETVKGMFTSPPEAISMLKADHDLVQTYFEKVKANEDGNNRATFNKIKLELDTHAHIEEKIFYPHLLEHGDKELKKIVQEGLEEHGVMKQLLTEIDALRSDSDTFKAKLKVLIENVEHHVEEEEGEMFKLTEDQIDLEARVRLAKRMDKEKVAFKKRIQKRGTATKSRKASATR